MTRWHYLLAFSILAGYVLAAIYLSGLGYHVFIETGQSLLQQAWL